MNNQFIDIVQLIKQSRSNAFKAVNAELINLYWNVGAHISKRMENASWGEKTVQELADYIQSNYSELKGFNRSGLYRMKQFYEIYESAGFLLSTASKIEVFENKEVVIVAPVVRQLTEKGEVRTTVEVQAEFSDMRNSILVQISWALHLIIFSRCKTEKEREFYIRISIKEKYSKRELDRQISAGLYERTILGNANFSKSLNEIHPDIVNSFRDSYVFEFLNLPEPFNESELQKGLLKQMKGFILELGKDFLFIGEEYKLQVGNSDFFIDLLFFHRALQCLVAFELKADKFKPEQIGQLNFYLEALDRDVKKSNENPSIGILLCKDKDREVVEYSMSRSLSPTMIAQYEIHLPDKKLLQQKLHELFEAGNRKM